MHLAFNKDLHWMWEEKKTEIHETFRLFILIICLRHNFSLFCFAALEILELKYLTKVSFCRVLWMDSVRIYEKRAVIGSWWREMKSKYRTRHTQINSVEFTFENWMNHRSVLSAVRLFACLVTFQSWANILRCWILQLVNLPSVIDTFICSIV